MSNIQALREVVKARQSGDVVAHSMAAFEASAHATVGNGADLMKIAVDFHTAAKLPPAAGIEILDLIQEATSAATKSRITAALAHEKMREFAKEHSIVYMGFAQCDPNEY
jgi:hypothetical protein